jgi:hypothetical protein
MSKNVVVTKLTDNGDGTWSESPFSSGSVDMFNCIVDGIPSSELPIFIASRILISAAEWDATSSTVQGLLTKIKNLALPPSVCP